MSNIYDRMQLDVRQTITEMAEHKHVLNVRPTFYPKIDYLCQFVIRLSGNGFPMLFVHSNDEDKKLAKANLNGYTNVDYISYKSLSKLKKIASEDFGKGYVLILFNEAHLTGAELVEKSLKTIFRLNPRALRVGVTSTPLRYDKKDICHEIFGGNRLQSYEIQDAVKSNIIPNLYYICGLKSTQLKQYLMSETDDRQIQREVYNIVNASSIINKTLLNVFKERPSKLDIVAFIPGGLSLETASKELADLLSESFRDYNINVMGAFREQIPARDGKQTKALNVVVNPNLNKSIKIDADCVMLLRSTTSQKVYIKQIGTVLKAGKKFAPIVLDFVDSLNTKLIYQNTNTSGGHGASYPNNQPVNVRKITVTDYRVELRDIVGKLSTAQSVIDKPSTPKEQLEKTEKLESKEEQQDNKTSNTTTIKDNTTGDKVVNIDDNKKAEKQLGISDLYWNRFIDLDGKTIINKPVMTEIMRLRQECKAPAEIISKLTGVSYVAVLLVLSLNRQKLQSCDYSTFIGPVPRSERSSEYSKEYIRKSMMKIRENSKLDLSSV